MARPLAPTALNGRSRSGADLLAKGLGWFSIGLGAVELLAPRAVCRAAGMDDRETLIRAYGAREVATGVAILASPDPEPWIWGRVAGDVLDIATVATSTRPGRSDQASAVVAVGLLAGVAVLDAVCAAALNREKGSRANAVADYSDRSGFPKGVAATRESARPAGQPQAAAGSIRPAVTGGQNADRAAERAPGPARKGEDLAERQDRLLDEALEETFPGSDPISPKHIT